MDRTNHPQAAALAIPNLLYLYADHMDAARFEEAAAMFRHGALLVDGKRIAEPEAMIALWRNWIKLDRDARPRTRHLVTNPAIDLAADGMSAKCNSQWSVLQQLGDGPLHIVATGRYHDRFAVIEGAWQFTERQYGAVDLIGDASGHLNQDLDRNLDRNLEFGSAPNTT